MDPVLTDDQRESLKARILANQSTFKGELEMLVAQGMEPEAAKDLLIREIKAMKRDAFNKAVEEQQSGERQKLLFILVFFLSVIGPFMGVTAIWWYLLVIAVAGISGYYAYRNKPIAGVVAALVFAIAFPLAVNFYLEGRESMIKIEIVIPMVMAAIPAWLAYYVLSKTVYPNED